MIDDADKKSEGFQDIVDGRLDDLFPLDDEDTGEKSEGLQDVVDSRLDDLFPLDNEDTEFAEKDQTSKSNLDESKEAPKLQKAEPPAKSPADKTQTEAASPLTSQQEKRAVSPATAAKTPVTTDSQNTKIQIPKGTTHPRADKKIGATEKKPAGKETIGMSREQKPNEPETMVAPSVDQIPPKKTSQRAIKAKSVVSKKEQQKSNPKQNKTRRGLLKLILGGVFIIGGVLVIFIFSQPPEPLDQSQPVSTPKIHKVLNLPAKAPETNTAPPVAQPIPPRVTATSDQPEIPSTHEKKTAQLSPVAAASTDKKTSAQVVTPVRSASSEITEWILEWAAAWEKCAGKKGDMTAFMSFYSDDFSSNGFDKNQWQKDKLEKNRRKAWIRIKLDNVNIVGPLGNGRYEARFTQVYQSSNYADTSKQILILKNETSGWKIVGIKPQTLTRYPFAIHSGSFRTLSTAQKAVEGYRKKGLEAYWTRVDLPGKGAWYRVFIGHYNSLESALKIIATKALIDAMPLKTRYANLIGTYSSEDDLQRQRRFIIESGCSPYVILDDTGDFNLYTGAYASLENAEKHSAELNAKGIPSQVVER